MKRLAVGIDPGVNTGFAVWDLDTQELEQVASMTITEALLRVQMMHQYGSLALLTFEDARLRTGWFGKNASAKKQGAGSIKRDCSIWAEWVALLGCPYKCISPKQKGAKVDAALFERMTKWQGRTNEHGRDAAMLVFGLEQ